MPTRLLARARLFAFPAVLLVLTPLCLGGSPDLNASGAVDEEDVLLFLQAWRARDTGAWDRAVDIHEDGVLNRLDAEALLEALHVSPGVSALLVTLDETDEPWLQVFEDAPGNPDFAGFAAWLLARGDIATAGAQECGVAAVTTDGISLLFTYIPSETLHPTHASPPIALPETAAALKPADVRGFGDLVPGGKALLIHCLPAGYADPRPVARDALEHAGFDVQLEDGDIEDFLQLADSSFSLISTHGTIWNLQGSPHYVLQADIMHLDNPAEVHPYMKWLIDGELAEKCVVYEDASGTKHAKWYLAVVDTWFANQLPSLPKRAALFLETCYSAHMSSPGDIFFKKGASAYFGFTRKVEDTWATDWVLRLLDRVTGANVYDPWVTEPPRRAHSFQNAYDYILEHDTSYDRSPVGGGRPKLYVPDSYFSAVPHTDICEAYPAPFSQGHYQIGIYGAFGPPGEWQAAVGGSAASLAQALGCCNGFILECPLGTKGDVLVTSSDGRESNLVRVSQFQPTVTLNINRELVEGTITLRFSGPAVTQRLYGSTDDDLLWLGGDQGRDPGFSHHLCGRIGEWDVEWEFDSQKTIMTAEGPETWEVKGEGQQHGDTWNDDGPSATCSFSVAPEASPPGSTQIQARANMSILITEDSLTWKRTYPDGTSDTWQAGLRDEGEAQTQYDLQTGQLSAIAGASLHLGGTWDMSSVALAPAPPSSDRPAKGPRSPLDQLWALATGLPGFPTRQTR